MAGLITGLACTEIAPPRSAGDTAGLDGGATEVAASDAGSGGAGGAGALDAGEPAPGAGGLGGAASDDAGADAPADEGDPDAAAADATVDEGADDLAPGTGPVPVFMAIGNGGRRLISCDDGRSWIGEQKVNELDDDHTEWAATGLAYGNGTFVASFGWFGVDKKAHVLRSEDGLTWQETLASPAGKVDGFATALSFGNGTFVVHVQRSSAYLSTDLGLTWETVLDFGPYDAVNLYSGAFIPYLTGRFYGRGDNRFAYSDDGGKHWTEGTDGATPCPHHGGNNIAYGNGVFLTSAMAGVCRSTDGGASWTRIDNGTNDFAGRLIWTGQDFYITSLLNGYRSPDGLTWTKVAHVRDSAASWVADLAISDKGTFVGVDQGGDQFFRSGNGATWTTVARGDEGPAALTGARITDLVFGLATRTARTAHCPAH